MEEHNEIVDPQLWHACAGSLVQIPTPNSTICYFPQGHLENAQVVTTNDFSGRRLRFPSLIHCRVESVKYHANRETDAVYTKINLIPLPNESVVLEDTRVLRCQSQYFVKPLTPSDANNGGGFSVPTHGAQEIFPPLDYQEDLPVHQILMIKDIFGKPWRLQHIYRGSPKRHLLQTGWNPFVTQKKLVAGDSLVFSKSENGDCHVGIRRAQRDAVGFASRLSELYNRGNEAATRRMESLKAKADAVMQVVALASSGQVFEVDYYAGPNKPAFCVNAAVVRAAMSVHWRSGLKFRMAFEKEDSPKIRWHMGTVSAVQVVDDQAWPNSPWKLLQVVWDEPDKLRKPKKGRPYFLPKPNRVSPWEVELLWHLPQIEFLTLSRPRPDKKPRVQPSHSQPRREKKPRVQPSHSQPRREKKPRVQPSHSRPVQFILHDPVTPNVIQGARHHAECSDRALSNHHSKLEHFEQRLRSPIDLGKSDEKSPIDLGKSDEKAIGNSSKNLRKTHLGKSDEKAIGNSSQNLKKTDLGKSDEKATGNSSQNLRKTHLGKSDEKAIGNSSQNLKKTDLGKSDEKATGNSSQNLRKTDDENSKRNSAIVFGVDLAEEQMRAEKLKGKSCGSNQFGEKK